MIGINRYITLFLCSVLMITLSLVPLSMASHSVDHHHHSAQSHTTGICAWMCTAAQTISTDSQIVSLQVSLLDILQPLPIVFEPAPHQPLFPARAPPSLL